MIYLSYSKLKFATGLCQTTATVKNYIAAAAQDKTPKQTKPKLQHIFAKHKTHTQLRNSEPKSFKKHNERDSNSFPINLH